jgi:hypothetical protein
VRAKASRNSPVPIISEMAAIRRFPTIRHTPGLSPLTAALGQRIRQRSTEPISSPIGTSLVARGIMNFIRSCGKECAPFPQRRDCDLFCDRDTAADKE